MLIVLSLGGSILAKDLNPERFQKYARVLRELAKKHTLLVVTGGGEAARDYITTARAIGADEVACDYIGIEITRLNARLLICALGKDAYPEIPGNYLEAAKALSSGKLVVMGGVTPGQTTDAVSAIAAEYLHADLLAIATSIDGVYSADPNRDPTAMKFDIISPEKLVNIVMAIEMKAGSKSPVDPVAAKIIERCKLKSFVMDGRDPTVLEEVLMNGIDNKKKLAFGTLIEA